MSRRGSNKGTTISLFSFQDIITCLSGIMILLVLILSLDIVTQKALEKTQGGSSSSPLKPEQITELPFQPDDNLGPTIEIKYILLCSENHKPQWNS